MFIRFDMIHERDRRTNGQTDRHRMPTYTALMHMHRAVKIVRFRWNLVHYSKCWTRLQSHDQKLIFFIIQDGGDRHLENRFFWPLLINRLSDFGEILCEEAEWHVDKGYMTKTKLQIFKIHDGGRPPFWKSLYRHISVKNLPILIIFGTQHQIFNPITVMWPKIEIFKTRDGDGRHLENRFSGHNSLTDCPISAKFCTRKQNGMPTKAAW